MRQSPSIPRQVIVLCGTLYDLQLQQDTCRTKTMMSPTSHNLPKACIMYTHQLRTSVAHPLVWLERHPTVLHPEPCRSQTSNRISLPTRRWPLQKFLNDRKPKCHTCHYSSTPNAGPAHDLLTPSIPGPAGEAVTLTILTSLWCPTRICSKLSTRKPNFDHPPVDPVSLSALLASWLLVKQPADLLAQQVVTSAMVYPMYSITGKQPICP